MTITGNFERFQYFNFETVFLENENPFQKNGVLLLIEIIKIENAPFLYKTTILEAIVKTNRIVGTKQTYHKEQSFASTYFSFLMILFQFKNLL